MSSLLFDNKIKNVHLTRKAFLYIRQSTIRQVYENSESTKRQYALKEKLKAMGWDESQIIVIDNDLGQSGAGTEERFGFQNLVSEVSLGRAGIIAGIEVSRLSRSSSDWGRLMQISALADTLIMDEDGVYNVNDFNDRLLLGLKGTMSEAELHYLKARMRGGLLNKAKRGELQRPIAIGYMYNDYGQIAKDPDAQVQQTISVFFNTFKRCGSAHSVVCEFNRQGLKFPMRQFKGFKLGVLTWKELTHDCALQTLKNPLYAGIFTYGRTQVQYALNGKKVKRMPREEWHTYLVGSHPAYVTEEEFEENNRILLQNAKPRHIGGEGGAVREGCALLQGIAICGVCGRKMTHRYSQSTHKIQPIYQCQHERVQHDGVICQSVNGENIDYAVGNLLLETINPMTIDAAIAVQQEMSKRKVEILRIYTQQLERARYEMELAKRRYLHVDPENRLVAGELEAEWNKKMKEHEAMRYEYDQKCAPEIQEVDEKLQASLQQLTDDFPKVWNNPKTSFKEKKRMIRLIIEDVTITAKKDIIILGVLLKGGARKVIEIPNIKRHLAVVQMEDEARKVIDALIDKNLTNTEIAAILSEKHFKTNLGKPYSTVTVAWLIKKYKLKSRIDRNDITDWLTTKEKMAELGVGEHKLRSMRRNNQVIWQRCNNYGKTYLYKQESEIVC
jgi:DNA invertase Pin-like site-specific DNA recombinase